MRPEQMANLCKLLSSAFPQWSPTGDTIRLMYQALSDLNYETVAKSVDEWILTEERPPTIAGLRRKCAEVAGVLGKESSEAWAEVSAIADEYGYENYGNKPRPRWSSPIIGKVVQAIGWWEICNGNNPTTTRAQFIKAYEQMASKHQKQIVATVGFQGENKLAISNSTVVELEQTNRSYT